MASSAAKADAKCVLSLNWELGVVWKRTGTLFPQSFCMTSSMVSIFVGIERKV